MLRPLCHRPPRHHTAAFNRIKGDGGAFTLFGVYHAEPQCSAYPFSFPFGDTPDHWRLGEHFSLTEDLVFWFNFFPEQPYLFERTFAVWALFQMSQLAGRGKNNQLVAFDGRKSLIAQGVSDFAWSISTVHQPARIFQRRARSRQTYLHGRSGLHLVRHAAEENVGRPALSAGQHVDKENAAAVRIWRKTGAGAHPSAKTRTI